MTNITKNLQSIFGDRLKQNEPLSKHTNFRIGGPAQWYVEARSVEELKKAIESAQDAGVPWHVLGGGSNTLASDEGFDGLVIQLGIRQFQIDPSTGSGQEAKVIAEAGVISSALARATAQAGLAGFEWAISLPGTIGGAVRGNAGCFGGEMKDVVVSVKLLRSGVVIDVPVAELKFGYRESTLKHSDDIVLSATLQLTPGDPAELKQRMDAILEKRKSTQPLYAGSAGCVFKNVEIVDEAEMQRLENLLDIPQEMASRRVLSAGWVIDQLDLKGKKIGQAQISGEHGNFVVNLGGATASDVVQLIALAKMYARDRFGIELKEEVYYLGF